MHGISDAFMKDGKENLQGKTRKTTQNSVHSRFWVINQIYETSHESGGEISDCFFLPHCSIKGLIPQGI